MNSNLKAESISSQGDFIKWLVVMLLFAAIIAANCIFIDQSAALRIAGNIIAGLIVLALASFTAKGKKFWLFARESRVELRKVIWPTRQETTQATLIIVVVVVLTALVLWGVDSILLWAISFLTGQRG